MGGERKEEGGGRREEGGGGRREGGRRKEEEEGRVKADGVFGWVGVGERVLMVEGGVARARADDRIRQGATRRNLIRRGFILVSAGEQGLGYA